MGPPMNLMLRYYTSDRPSKRPNSGESSMSTLKLKGSMESSGSESVTYVGSSSSSGAERLASNSPELVVPDPEEARKRKRVYEMRRHFQDNWGAKFAWVEAVHGANGEITQVRCSICTAIEGRNKLLIPKIDGLWKHAGQRKALKDMSVGGKQIKAGQFYFIQTNAHVKNERLFASRPRDTVRFQIESQVMVERKKKLVQFTCLLYLLSKGRPMTDYEQMSNLCVALSVPDCPRKHWSDNSGWEMALLLADIVLRETRRSLLFSPFISLSADEVTTPDNQQWLSVHAYVVKLWKRFPILLSLDRVTVGTTAENIHSMIVSSILSHGNLSSIELAEKLVCFSADGASTFQGCRNGVVQLLARESTPYVNGVHCCAHRTNLAADKLSTLPVISNCERLVQHLYSYFHKSPKRYAEFEQLAEELELQGLKMLRNVTTRWVSLIEPLERVLNQIQPLIVKMSTDCNTPAAEKNLDLLLDLPTLLSLPAVMPLLVSVNNLCKFAQDRDTYICDFMAAVKICQSELYSLYIDSSTSWTGPEFQRWCDVVGDSTHLLSQEWRTDMNTNIEYLSLKIGDHSYETHFLGAGGFRSAVNRSEYVDCVGKVKEECAGAAKLLIQELDERFPDVDLLNALGIVFPQYWMQPDCESSFYGHLTILKAAFCESKSVPLGADSSREVKPISTPLSAINLDNQASMFKISMMTNSLKIMEDKTNLTNPMTRLWTSLNLSQLLCQRIPEYFKVAHIAIVTLVGSVEDERTFSNLTFIKNKLRNRLVGPNLDCSLKLFAQQFFTLETFPYEDAYDNWRARRERLGAAF